jgi:hypothetical protein
MLVPLSTSDDSRLVVISLRDPVAIEKLRAPATLAYMNGGYRPSTLL